MPRSVFIISSKPCIYFEGEDITRLVDGVGITPDPIRHQINISISLQLSEIDVSGMDQAFRTILVNIHPEQEELLRKLGWTRSEGANFYTVPIEPLEEFDPLPPESDDPS